MPNGPCGGNIVKGLRVYLTHPADYRGVSQSTNKVGSIKLPSG